MRLFILLITVVSCSGCASNYRQIRPKATQYPPQVATSTATGDLEFSYKFGVLRERRNNKYAKREDKNAIRLAAVKIVNNSENDLTVGTDFVIMSSNAEAILLDPTTLHQELKQGVPIYLLYLLLSPLQLTTSSEVGQTQTTPIGLIIGPGISVGNMIVAGSANKSFLNELTTYSIIGKTIKPGDTLYGIIGIRDFGYAPLSIKLNQGANKLADNP